MSFDDTIDRFYENQNHEAISLLFEKKIAYKNAELHIQNGLAIIESLEKTGRVALFKALSRHVFYKYQAFWKGTVYERSIVTSWYISSIKKKTGTNTDMFIYFFVLKRHLHVDVESAEMEKTEPIVISILLKKYTVFCNWFNILLIPGIFTIRFIPQPITRIIVLSMLLTYFSIELITWKNYKSPRLSLFIKDCTT